MGAALILAPLLLLFLVAPLLYVFFAALAVRKVTARNRGKAKVVAGGFVAVVSLVIPAYVGADFLKFKTACATPQPPVEVTQFPEIKTIAFVTEGGFSNAPFLWHDEMNLDLNEFEYAKVVDGKVVMRNLCNRPARTCKYGGDLSSRFMFLVTAPKPNQDGVLQSNISIVDRESGTTLYQTREYVLKGLLASYHGAFIAEPGHRGILSCGYLDERTDVWRPNGPNASRARYAAADTRLLAAFFPALAAR